MKASTVISSEGWENRLFDFWRTELAASPTRWRASFRLCALCVLGTALITAFTLPGGQFIVLMLFLVGMNDAETSRATVVSNVVGSFAGGALGVLVFATFMDQPWILFPMQGAVIAAAMYLLRRSNRPFALLFFAVSFVIMVPDMSLTPIESFYSGMRAVGFQACGIGLGTLGQVLWWPEDPKRLLVADLAESLRSVEFHCRTWSYPDPPRQADPTRVRSLRDSAARLARQLDWLRQAEERAPNLRPGHAAQTQFISQLQLLLFAALEIDRRGAEAEWSRAVSPQVAQRLAAVEDACRRIQYRLMAAPTPVSQCPDNLAETKRGDSIESPTADSRNGWPELEQLERILTSLQESFRAPDKAKPVVDSRLPKGNASSFRLLNPTSLTAHQEAVQFGLKVGLAASVSGIIYQALDWPGIGTCVLTAVLVAQATVGAGLHKSALRLGGALLAGLAVLLVIAGLMPNMQSLASLLVVTAVLTFIAAWIGSGGSRTAYLGAQMGITLYLVLLPGSGPTLELAPARDRLIGILLGIGVMAFVDATLWPVFTRSALRRKLGGLVRELQAIHQGGAGGDRTAVAQRFLGVQRGVGEALILREELIFETTAGDAQAEAEQQVVTRSLDGMLGLLLRVWEAERLPLGVDMTPGSVGGRRVGDVSTTRDGLRDEIAAQLQHLVRMLEGERADSAVPSSAAPA